jgi:hypothetical protein
MRFYQYAVAPAFTDDLISAGLSHRPDQFMDKFIANIVTSPPSPERDQALGVLRYIHQSDLAGVYVGLVRLVLDRMAGRAG